MPYGTLVTEEAFIKFYGARCYYCKTDIKYGEHGLTFFERDYTMLCRKCSGYSEEVVRPLSRVYVPKASFSAFAS